MNEIRQYYFTLGISYETNVTLSNDSFEQSKGSTTSSFKLYEIKGNDKRIVKPTNLKIVQLTGPAVNYGSIQEDGYGGYKVNITSDNFGDVEFKWVCSEAESNILTFKVIEKPKVGDFEWSDYFKGTWIRENLGWLNSITSNAEVSYKYSSSEIRTIENNNGLANNLFKDIKVISMNYFINTIVGTNFGDILLFTKNNKFFNDAMRSRNFLLEFKEIKLYVLFKPHYSGDYYICNILRDTDGFVNKDKLMDYLTNKTYNMRIGLRLDDIDIVESLKNFNTNKFN